MGDIFRAQVKTALIGARLAKLEGRPFEHEDVADWLAANGFVREADGWWKVDATDLGQLSYDEIVDVQGGDLNALPEESPDSGDWFERLLIDQQNSDRERLNKQPVLGHLVPKVLIGKHRDVKSRWRSVVKKAVKSGSWDQALAGAEWVPVDHAPGSIVCQGPSLLIQGEHFLAYLIMDVLCDAAPKWEYRAEHYATIQRMALSGMDHFWFCLGTLDQHGLIDSTADPKANAPIQRNLLEKVLRWWPDLCALKDRFSCAGIPMNPILWGAGSINWARGAGMPESQADPLFELQKNDPLAVGQTLCEWVASTNNRNETHEP
jgi:hypothetical protein